MAWRCQLRKTEWSVRACESISFRKEQKSFLSTAANRELLVTSPRLAGTALVRRRE